ncbi:hypothetical protein PMAYCL1PPCAC_14610, partial [Pristionchus mayeri]
ISAGNSPHRADDHLRHLLLLRWHHGATAARDAGQTAPRDFRGRDRRSQTGGGRDYLLWILPEDDEEKEAHQGCRCGRVVRRNLSI